MVGLDEDGLVHDFYYPYVGLDNLTTAHNVHHNVGLWVDGVFSWIDDGSWDIKVDFEKDALISSIKMKSLKLGIEINFRDFVDNRQNSFIRRIKITNLLENSRDIRLFMHQIFQISRGGRADTVLYVPEANYILNYKGRYVLLIYGQTSKGVGMDQYAVGNYGIEGKKGTYVDAEDGELSGSTVEHGSVDSVLRISTTIKPNGSENVDYWIIASDSQYDCEQVHKSYLEQSIEKVENGVRRYWLKWLAIGKPSIDRIDKKYRSLVQKSMMLIATHCDKRGSILASGDSSILNYGRDYYCYCWPRDSAYAIWPLIRMGYRDEPKRFFEFCRDVLHPDGYLAHKYLPDKSVGSTWHSLLRNGKKELAIQEDETAIVICMLGEYYDHSKDYEFVESVYSTFIKPAANFMLKFTDKATGLPHASYDLWEEKFLTSTYTCALVEHALKRAAKFAELFDFPEDSVQWLMASEKIKQSFEVLYDPENDYFRKGFLLEPDDSLTFDNVLDISSFYGVLMFKDAKQDADKLIKTAEAVENRLTNLGPAGGTIRYENDRYLMDYSNSIPNPWFVCSLWLAQYYVLIKELDQARALLDWAQSLAYPSGVFSEQIKPVSGQPAGVAPLVWSHAEFINTALDIADETSPETL
jgi:GH15 family glucan-1,4-alpha-glucosidase